MSDSFVLHDVMRKVKADGLFDTIRRDLISDLEQKASYLDLKSQIESLMSSYLSEHKWSSSLKKSDIRERARRHIETSNLVKDNLPSLVNEYMQTCQDQLIQPRLSSFVSDHLDHIYHSIGGTHIYRPTTSFTQSISVQQESIKKEKPPPPVVPVKKEPIPPKPQPPNVVKQKIIPKQKPLPVPTNPVKEEKKPRIASPLHSPTDLVDISPSPPSVEHEPAASSSPPPPVVRVASPIRPSSKSEIPRKTKRVSEHNEEKKKKIKTVEPPVEKVEEPETDTRKLRSRRPNPKYLNEQYETDDLNILEAPASPIHSKSKKLRQSKSSTSFDTPSSPTGPNEAPVSINDMSPEYGTSLPSPKIEKDPVERIDEPPRSPSPVVEKSKKSASPRRLRPRKAYERSSTIDNPSDKTSDSSTRTSSRVRESSRLRTEQTDPPLSTNNEISPESTTTNKPRHSSSSGGENSITELPVRSLSVPDSVQETEDEEQTARVSPAPTSAPVSKSFIWKPKISK